MPEEQPKTETVRHDFQPVVKTLQNGDDPTRAAAAAALGESGDLAAVPALIAALEDDPILEVRCNAAVALGRLGDVRAIESLIVALNDKSEDLFSCAGVALLRLGAASVQPLIAQLQNADIATRDIAIMLLGWLNNPAAVEPIFAALRDEDSFIRSHAANALVSLDQHALPVLLEKLTDTAAYIRQDATYLLGRIGHPSVLEPLIQVLNMDDDPAVRLKAVFALRALKDDAIVAPLTGALDDLDRAVRVNAAVALKTLGTAEAINAVMAHQRRFQVAVAADESTDESPLEENNNAEE